MNTENENMESKKFPKREQGGFSVPENYFETLSDRILNKINQKPKLYSLENIEKVNVFRVPDGYFEELSSRIESRFKKSKSVFRIIRNTQFWTAAASILIVIGLAWYFVVPKKSEVDLALENVSKEEIQTYLSNQDLGYLEIEAEAINEKNQADGLILDNLEINKKDILEHLENENLEESFLEDLTGT